MGRTTKFGQERLSHATICNRICKTVEYYTFSRFVADKRKKISQRGNCKKDW